MNCHMCGNETEFICRQCEEPVCEECVVEFTIHNQFDYDLCKSCGEGNESRAYLARMREESAKEKREKELSETRAIRNAAARKRYRLPENVEKRREKRRELMELRRKQFAETMKIVARIFGGSDD